ITDELIEEAIEKNIDLIITHHPLIFSALKSITDDSVMGKKIIKLMKHNINVYTSHTNLDSADGGLNDYLAELIGLDRVSYLEKVYSEKYYKLTTFVPHENAENVRMAVCDSGAGNIGDYSDCSFSLEGSGTFRPLEGSNPHIGTNGVLEKVDETRQEFVVNESDLSKAIQALISSHPYETPAYDLIKLENEIESYGIARYGFLEKAMTTEEFIEHVKEKLKIPFVKLVGSPEGKVFKVALCTGAGADYIRAAKHLNCDIYITGDTKYHEGQLASEIGLKVLDTGHYETEAIYMERLKEILARACEKKDYDVKIIVAETCTNFFKYF
ncbi:MAG: Nif3-like dinuclear metal center hexameric protein, partial [Acidaminobacteraceae bacterium]